MQSGGEWCPVVQKSDEPFYLSLIRALQDDVAAGRLAVGTRLPTQRDLATRLGVALGTVTRAYAEAARRGLVHGDGRRGTFVGEPPSARSLLSSLYREANAGVDLSKNHPAAGHDPDLAPVLRQISQASDVQHLLQYPPSSGYSHHREAGRAWLERLGLTVDPDRLYICAGAQHALMVIFSAETRPGDRIATEAYTYPGTRTIADLMGLELVGVEMDDEGPIPDAFESLCKRQDIRLFYFNPTYQNPTNAIMSLDRRRRIAEVAATYGVTIVEDEVLAPLMDRHPGFLSALAPEQSYCVISSSKALAAGLRIGFIAAPQRAVRRLNESLQASILGVPPLMAEIFARWHADGTLEKTVARRKRELAEAQRLTATILHGHDLRGQATSYHVWLRLPEPWTSLRFAAEAQARGVAVTPAELFAADRSRSVPAVRLSVGAVSDREALKSGLETLRDLLAGVARADRATV